jgi:hypothetical protein
MPPIARLRRDEPLPVGQTTLLNTLNGSLAITRPPHPLRQGPKPNCTNKSTTILGRRLVGGVNEQQAVKTFANARLEEELPEPGDEDITRGVFDEDLEDSEDDYVPVHKRHAYSREHKLIAIDYFNTTWKELEDGTFERLSCRYAARKLKITRKMLRSWVCNKEKILAQPKGTFRSRRQYALPKEAQLEDELDAEFDTARKKGRKVSKKWILRHARAIYARLYPHRVVTPENTHKKVFLGFKFSTGWYNGFRKRKNISLRCGTKRAQKSPEELFPVIQNWLQFNRRLMVIRFDSICGIPRGPTVITVGRFKLSEIGNMDQSPLAFEFLKGRTLARRGDRTIALKGAKSGWEKRQCTLQIYVSADGIDRCKPLLMFKGKAKGDSRRKQERKKYHPGVVVIFNEKAYANTSNLIDWIKQQYSMASAYPLRDHEPRFLALDAFAPHKNKGRKDPGKESDKAKGRRLKEEALQQELRNELSKLYVITSIIPGGCTGYVQVLDVTVNKIIKQYIEEAEDQWVDEHLEEWDAGKFSVGDRRVLLTYWVAEAWKKLYQDHQDAIIKTFQNVGLSLPTDGSKDHLLKIRDLPHMTIADWQRAPEGTGENPAIIDDDVGDSIEVDDGYLYKAGEDNSTMIKQEKENNMTTDSSDDKEDYIDFDSQSDFNEDTDGDEDEGDENMD